ncbi:MAG: PAS domain S-box protein, partial [Deltaproteobacteria bacterium]|nr:PAS domain S-box protein [Deltaproteobacteria bacterium]
MGFQLRKTMLWPFSSKESSLEEDRERLRLLTRQTLLALLGNLGNMAVITLVLWPVVSHTLLTGWTTLNGVVTLLRLGLWWPRRQEKALDSLSQAELLSQARLFTSLAAVSGLLWGLVPVVLFPEGNFIYQAFMAFLIGGLTAGVIASYGVVSWLAPAFFLPVCLPLAGRFYLETSEISFTAGSLVLLFTLVALALSRNVHLITMQAIRLAVEKDGLLETLARAKEETEALNRELMAEIEERVALEKASHEAEAREERLRALAEAVPLPLLVVGKDGRHLLYANEPSRELFGLGEMKPGKIGIDSLYANQEQWNEVVRTVEAEGLISGAVHVLKKPDGREFQAIVNGQPMLFGGEPALMFGIFDLTSELEAGAEARTSRRLLRVVVDTVPHWIYLKDSQERYVMVNRSMARDFDMEPEQFIGRVYADFSLAAGEEVMLLSRADNQVLERNTPVELEEVDFRRADGRLMKRHEIKLPWHDDESRVRGVVGVSMDITERQAAEMELKESEQRYRDLIEGSLQGIVIHREFQPLFVNQAFADILGFASSRDVLSLGSLRSYLMPEDDVSGQVVDIPAENTGQNREIKTVQGTEIKTVQGTEIKTVQG